MILKRMVTVLLITVLLISCIGNINVSAEYVFAGEKNSDGEKILGSDAVFATNSDYYFVNGKKLKYSDFGASAYEDENGTVMVPCALLAEGLGVSIVCSGGKILANGKEVTVGSKVYGNITLDAPPYEKSGVYFVPAVSFVEKVLGKKLDIPTGDGGLLVERWVGYYPEKKYKVGIIPHFKEQEHPSVKKLLEGYEDTTLINLREDPKTVCEKIGECEYIISSSLHGMIVADSFHIPNIHITLNNGMFGDGNKFADYLSGFGVEHIPFDCEKGDIPSLQLVKDNYKISIEQVEQKKQQLFDAFPRL